MPRSKRAKVVHLSKTQKKGKDLTIKLHATVQDAIPKYPYIYVFRVDNMRNTYLKDVRTRLSDSRLFFGKTKVMAVALGLSKETESLPNISNLTPYLRGNVGLLFSSRSPESILQFFANYQPADFARSGTIASRDFIIPAGTVYSRAGEVPREDDMPFAHSAEPLLRKFGVPSSLVKGKVQLDSEFVVCRQGDVLGSGQTSLLKMFGVALASFVVEIQAYYHRERTEVHVVTQTGPPEDAAVMEDFDGFDE